MPPSHHLQSLDCKPVAEAKNLISNLVLQPWGCLNRDSSAAFQLRLEQALHQAVESVMVDLVWVEAIDSTGVEMLKTSIHLATQLDKSLSFRGLHPSIQAKLEIEQSQQRLNYLGKWSAVLLEDFDRFLSQPLHAAKKSSYVIEARTQKSEHHASAAATQIDAAIQTYLQRTV
jgi:anti-anti-sigma regulatory factor